MRNKFLIATALLVTICLTGCGAEEEEPDTSVVLDLPGLEVDDSVSELFADDSVPKERIDLPSGDYVDVLIPDGYTKMDFSGADSALQLAYISDADAFGTTDEYVLIEWILAPLDEASAYVINPMLANFEQTDVVTQLLPNPVVSDITTYITGDKTIVGLSVHNYVDLSAVNVTYPTYVIPEVNYMFNLDDSYYLIMRVSCNSELVPLLVSEAYDAAFTDNFTPSEDLSEEDFDEYSTFIDTVANEVCTYAYYYVQ